MAKDQNQKDCTIKKCIKCHETKDLIDFDLGKSKDGRRQPCKTCRRQDPIEKEKDKIYKQIHLL
jgi:hypothetical protein